MKYPDVEVLQPHVNMVWASPVSLAATQGISVDFSSTVTEMFQFAVYPPHTLCVQVWVLR